MNFLVDTSKCVVVSFSNWHVLVPEKHRTGKETKKKKKNQLKKETEKKSKA